MDSSTFIALATVVSSSAVTALVALGSHIFTIVSSNRDVKLAYEQRKIDTIEKYIESIYGVVSTPNTVDFCNLSGVVRLYIDSDLWPILDQIHDAKLSHNDNLARELASDLLKSLSFKESRRLLIRAKKHVNR